MITDFFLSLGASVSMWIAGLFPAWEVPSWMVTLPERMKGILATFSGLGVWVDWTAVGICVAAVVGAYVVGFSVRLLRALIAHIPAVGGGG